MLDKNNMYCVIDNLQKDICNYYLNEYKKGFANGNYKMVIVLKKY